MQWIRFITIITLFGTLLCDRLVDNRLIDFSTPYAASVKNIDAEKAAYLESMNNVHFMADNSQHHNDLSALYQKNYPYHRSDKTKEDLQNNAFSRVYDYKNPYLDETNKNYKKSELKLDNENFIFRNRIQPSHENRYNTQSGTFRFSDLDDSLEMEESQQILPAVDSFNVLSFYDDLLQDSETTEAKRGASVSSIGCDCKIKNDLLDLGQRHFPRYLLNAVCQSTDVRESKCWRGICKPLEYKVKVLTSFHTVKDQKDPALAWLPDDLRQLWRFKTVTVAAGCFCAVR